MKHNGFLLICLLVGLAGRAFAVQVPADVTVHFAGDSIIKGYGFADYSNPSPLARIQDICTLLLDANVASHPVMHRLENANYGARPGALIADNIASGAIGPNDWIIYEDAADARLYRDYRTELRLLADASEGANRTLLLMTMFDYATSGTYNMYDRLTDDVPVKTINDAFRDEGVVRGNRVIDMNACMDGYHDYLLANGWGSPVLPDGVHPNVFGNTLMAFRILRSLGYNIDTWDISSLEQHFLHPTAGDVSVLTASPWLWPKDGTDTQRRQLVQMARTLSALPPEPRITSAYELQSVTGGGNHPIPTASFWHPSSTDLVNVGSPALASVTTTNFQQGTPGFLGFPNPALNNGTAGATDSDAVFDANGFTVTYSLALASAPRGYDISKIETYAAGPGGTGNSRGDQHYELFVAYANAPSVFVSLGTFNAYTGGDAGGTQLIIRGNGSDLLASGVSAVRFVIPDAILDSFYREFDVFGAATVPEPSTTAMLAALGFGGTIALLRKARNCHRSRRIITR
jgi:hypothetical protein